MSEGDFKARVLILGGRGMLGRAVTQATRAAGYQVWSMGREHDIADFQYMKILDHTIKPQIVVNCAGIIPERSADDFEMVRVNGYGPWVVRLSFPTAIMVQVSTDCVFDGSNSRMAHIVNEVPAPKDLYGRTKSMGEVSKAVVVRTSFIGFEHGLLKWFLSQSAGTKIAGWERAMWSGATVYDVAEALVFAFSWSPGTYHMAAPTVSKYELLVELGELFRQDVTIIPTPTPVINRALVANAPIRRNLFGLLEHRLTAVT